VIFAIFIMNINDNLLKARYEPARKDSNLFQMLCCLLFYFNFILVLSILLFDHLYTYIFMMKFTEKFLKIFKIILYHYIISSSYIYFSVAIIRKVPSFFLFAIAGMLLRCCWHLIFICIYAHMFKSAFSH